MPICFRDCAAVTFCHQSIVNCCLPDCVKPAALNNSAAIRNPNRNPPVQQGVKTMKTLFAALASALLVSTAFAQTAAPAASQSAQPAQTQAAGQANLKASTAVQTGASDDSAATAKAPSATTAKSHVKTSSKHVTKKHKAVKKTPADSSAAKA